MKDMGKEQMDWVERKYYKMKHKRNFLFRAFVINFALVLGVWLLSLTGLYDCAFRAFTNFTPEEGADYLIKVIGLWKVAGVVMFLVPALSAWWCMRAMRRCMNH